MLAFKSMILACFEAVQLDLAKEYISSCSVAHRTWQTLSDFVIHNVSGNENFELQAELLAKFVVAL